MDPLILAGGIVVGLVVLFAIFKLMWRVAEPNEALVISGLREHSSPAGAGESSDPRGLARDGLVGLGYTMAEAESLLAGVDGDTPEELIATALRRGAKEAA